VVSISSCGRITVIKIQSAKYIRFRDIQLHEFEREGLTASDDKLDLDMYRCLLRRVFCAYYGKVLIDDDFVCLFEFEMLPAFQVQHIGS
jgi:hypothetical protein